VATNNGFDIVQLLMEYKTVEELDECKHMIDQAYRVLRQQYLIVERFRYYGGD